MRRDLLNEASPLNMNGKSSRDIREEIYRTWTGQAVEARAKALKYDRKWLRRTERCTAAAAELVERSRHTGLQATLLCKCHTLRKMGFMEPTFCM